MNFNYVRRSTTPFVKPVKTPNVGSLIVFHNISLTKYLTPTFEIFTQLCLSFTKRLFVWLHALTKNLDNPLQSAKHISNKIANSKSYEKSLLSDYGIYLNIYKHFFN